MTRRIIAAVDDLFFASKIRAVAEHLGLSIEFARSEQALIESAHREAPDLIVVDLHSQKFRPLELAAQLKADPQLNSIHLLGFFSHVETELQSAAQQAGFVKLLPRSAFSNHLPDILKGEF